VLESTLDYVSVYTV